MQLYCKKRRYHKNPENKIKYQKAKYQKNPEIQLEHNKRRRILKVSQKQRYQEKKTKRNKVENFFKQIKQGIYYICTIWLI